MHDQTTIGGHVLVAPRIRDGGAIASCELLRASGDTAARFVVLVGLHRNSGLKDRHDLFHAGTPELPGQQA